MEIEIIENLNGVHNLKLKWEELFRRAQPGLFIHHSWTYENYRCFNVKDILLLAVYGDKKKLIGIFPFAVETFRIKWLKFKTLVHGGSAVTDYSYFLIDPASNSRLMIKRVLEKLVEIQPGKWDIFKIDNLSDGDIISNLFRNMMLRTSYAGAISTEITPIIEYSHGYEEAKKVANTKRRFKKIVDDSSITHKHGTDIDEQLLQDFSRLHKFSFPDSGFDMEKAQTFYKALINDASFNQHVCLSYISHEEKMIAAHFGFKDSRTFYYYVPTYDEKFSKYGPGQYLLWKLISLASEKKLLEFDFLRGSEKYKFNWTNKVNTNYTVFGVAQNSSFFIKLLINLWLLTKEIPFFKQSTT